MDAVKQQWSVEETTCLLAIWSTDEVQAKLEGATQTKPVLHQIQKEMAAAGYKHPLEQISNKLKKLKKDYRDQKKDLGRSGNGRPRKNPQFNILDSVLGNRPAKNATGALNSATAMLEAMVDNTLPQSEPELSTIGDEDLMSPLHCSSPAPSSSSGQSQQTRPAKRKRDSNTELLDYLERADERFLQHSKEMNDALLHKLEADNSAFLSMMGRMVSVMEAQARK
ncbi:uncharacterized protein LOC132889770 [Neoarius graeffei]|uniref:uncharacterized protein LOC132889769 n=1 Tax=Neoarius graeffei TaxID=443677 RepID=UPI00298C936F|nr:uncharacterized protein LOC132889769 [Neoarius graeffei]XP_060782570.1 uncharacterized protein LOC132889770 [Neoarius graeffei]